MKLPVFDPTEHTYTLDGRRIPSVTGILKDGGVVDSKFFTEEARERGSLLHRLVLMQINNELDETSVDPRPEIKGRFLAWKKFRRESGFTPFHSERVVYSPSWDYAGTFDTYGNLNGRLVLLDYKTGAMPKWVGYQLAGYELAMVESGYEKPMRRYGLHLKENGSYKLVRCHDDIGDRSNFIQCVNKSRGIAA